LNETDTTEAQRDTEDAQRTDVTLTMSRPQPGPHADITEKIIGCAIEVHRTLGPGLLESTYENALCIELGAAGLSHERQRPVPLVYKGQPVGEYRLDLIVEQAVIVEIKTVERLDPIFEAQLLTYLRLAGKRVGLLINFHTVILKSGIKRLVL
jgi:GxxExxY protein